MDDAEITRLRKRVAHLESEVEKSQGDLTIMRKQERQVWMCLTQARIDLEADAWPEGTTMCEALEQYIVRPTVDYIEELSNEDAALEASRAECARLRVALEASRLSHDYVDEDVWYSCPKWPGFNGTCPRCANAGKPCECECYCGADSHNARIAAALNGAADATVGEP